MTFDPSLRPLAHFTAERNWINDPNGLVWHDGEYHLFFQHNPEGVAWGNMSWGHAVSADLQRWTELGVAIPYADTEHVFSGCVVFDATNSSGLGTTASPPLVAVYTAHDPRDGMQRQALASSTDRGRTWTRYPGNPVLDIGSTEFRDPKVFRHGDSWVMVVVLADRHRVRLYRSADLIAWTELSEFGPTGCTEGVWECPDLVRVPIEGQPGATAWVMLISASKGHPAGGSGTQYVVGSFDGTAFAASSEARWLDFGADFYAAVSYADLPEGAPIIQAWMSNWEYAADLPAAERRGAMSLARRLSLRRTGDSELLVQEPVVEVGEAPVTILDQVWVDGRRDLPGSHGPSRLSLEAMLSDGGSLDLELHHGSDEVTRIGVDRASGTLTLDRTRSSTDPAVTSLLPRQFFEAHTAPYHSSGVARLEIVVDHTSVEVIGQAGTVTLTDLILPSSPTFRLGVATEGGPVEIRSLTVAALPSTEGVVE